MDAESMNCFREKGLIKYFTVIENGKKIVKWPPPVFIPLLTLVQLVLFVVHEVGPNLEETLQFDT